MDRLDPHHHDELKGSGLTDAMIGQSGFFSCDEPRARELMGWRRKNDSGRYLVIPCRGIDGEILGYRCKPPVVRNGAKYLQPAGAPSFAYCLGWDDGPHRYVVICEGEKKALAVHQVTGQPTIGLAGIWNWGKKDGKVRRLIPPLQKIEWGGRKTIILFDTDAVLKTAVLHAAAELARVLTDHGAITRILWLPPGPEVDGMPSKSAADDYLFENGPDALRELIEGAAEDIQPIRLVDAREAILAARRQKLVVGTFYLDRSPPGTGKTFADMKFARDFDGKSIFVVPTHDQAREIERSLRIERVDAAAYPKLTGQGDDRNCQNIEGANAALRIGLSPSQAVCPRCPHQAFCEYQHQVARADGARTAICTHERAKLVLTGMAKERHLISIHESTVDVLAPTFETGGGFGEIIDLLQAIRRTCDLSISWRGTERDWWTSKAVVMASRIEDAIGEAESVSVELTSPIKTPDGMESMILHFSDVYRIKPRRTAMQILMGVLGGRCRSIRVETRRGDDGGRQRVVIASMRTLLPSGAIVIAGDASTSAPQVAKVCPRPVVDITPRGEIETLHPIIQVPREITRRTKPASVLAALRGVLTLCEHYPRLGLITHPHIEQVVTGDAVSPAEPLEPHLARRFTRIDHFFGTSTRGSNAWIQDCDAVIVFGTPRVPPKTVRTKIIQLGHESALDADPCWLGKGRQDDKYTGFYWSGLTLSGHRRTVRGFNYGDHRWREAYSEVVGAELEQCVGRGRSITDAGIPVIAVTTWEVPVARLVDQDPPSIDETDLGILMFIGEQGRTTWDQVEVAIGKSRQRNRRASLRSSGLVGTSIDRKLVLTELGRQLAMPDCPD